MVPKKKKERGQRLENDPISGDAEIGRWIEKRQQWITTITEFFGDEHLSPSSPALPLTPKEGCLCGLPAAIAPFVEKDFKDYFKANSKDPNFSYQGVDISSTYV